MSAPLCPFCGAYSIRSCELIDEAGCCPWEVAEVNRSVSDGRAYTPASTCLETWPDGSSTRLSFQIKVF